MGLQYRSRCLSEKGTECMECGSSNEIVAHHINGDRSDNRLENLVPVCRSCHQKIHLGNPTDGWLGELQRKLPPGKTTPDRGVKTVRVDEDTHQRIEENKLVESETFGSVVDRALDALEDAENDATD